MKSEIWDKNGKKAFTEGYDIKNIELFDQQCEKFLRAVLFENSLIDKTFSESIDNLEKANFLIHSSAKSPDFEVVTFGFQPILF